MLGMEFGLDEEKEEKMFLERGTCLILSVLDALC